MSCRFAPLVLAIQAILVIGTNAEPDQCDGGSFGYPDCLGRCEAGQQCKLLATGMMNDNFEVVDLAGPGTTETILKTQAGEDSSTLWDSASVDGHCLFRSRNSGKWNAFDQDRYQVSRTFVRNDHNLDVDLYLGIIQGRWFIFTYTGFWEINKLESLEAGWEPVLPRHPDFYPDAGLIQTLTILDDNTLVGISRARGHKYHVVTMGNTEYDTLNVHLFWVVR